jgi:hypothetical protein
VSTGPAVTYVVQSDVWLDGRGPFSTGPPGSVQTTCGCIWVRRGTLVSVVPGSALAARYGGAGNLAPLDMTRNCGDQTSKAALAN